MKVRYVEPPTPQTPKPPSIPEPKGILLFFNIDTLLAAKYSKNLPPKKLRWKPEYWDQRELNDSKDNKQRENFYRYFMAVLGGALFALCDEASEACRSWFLKKIQPLATEDTPVLQKMGDLVVSTKKGSVERKILRAALCGVFPRSVLVDARSGSLHVSRDTYTKARQHYEILLEEGMLRAVSWTRAKFNPARVDFAITHILGPKNASYLSWGTKQMTIDGVTHDVPAILRKKPASVIYDEYVVTCKNCDNVPISRSSFYRVVDTLTHGELRERKSVDYVTGRLVYDTFDRLREIVASLFPDDSAAFDSELEVVTAWLKYAHASYASDRGCGRHDILFGLSDSTADQSTEARVVACDACKSLHTLFYKLRQRILSVDADPSAMQVICDIYHKLHLFMGHQIRVVNQQNALKLLAISLEKRAEEGSLHTALVIIDFKMKAEPIYFKEKTSDHFGKQGMSWHGVLVRHWEQVIEEGASVRRVIESKVYCDHLSDTDNKQDKGAVLAMFEAAILAIKRDLPHITKLVVQSDNASSYQNAAVMLWFSLIGAAHGVEVVRYIHTETQDGKSMLDAHFAQAMRKILRHVRQQNNCVTPSQIVSALTSDGGLLNCMAELITYDRDVLNELLDKSTTTEVSFTKLAGRVNDIKYELPFDSMPTPFDISKLPDFTVRVFHYSNIGEGLRIVVSMSRGICYLHGCESPEHSLVEVGSVALVATAHGDCVVNIRQDDVEVENASNVFNASDQHAAAETGLDGEDNEEDCEDRGNRVDYVAGLAECRDAADVGFFECHDGDGADDSCANDEPDIFENHGIYLSTDEDSDDDEEVLNEAGLVDDEKVASNDADEEMVDRATNVGAVTNVAIQTKSQIRRRVRKWKTYKNSDTIEQQVLKWVQQDRNLFGYTKRALLSMRLSRRLQVVDVPGLPERLASMVPECNQPFDDFPLPTLVQGWAIRPARGKMYGANYIALYEEDIADLFQHGAAHSARAGRMLEALKKKYKGRFNLPAESEIRTAISKLFASSKRKASSQNPSDPQRKKKRVLQDDYEAFLIILVKRDSNIMPKEGLNKLREMYPNTG